MGNCYSYDGTFAGLLTLLDHLLPQQAAPEGISVRPPEQQSLFAASCTIATDEERARACWAELTRRLPHVGCRHLQTVWLADHPQREMLIYRYCLLAWQQDTAVFGRLSHRDVAPIWKLSQQVGREAHRYLGFVRFQEVTGGFYYAAIAPDHRILTLIATHFATRFGDQQWVINDVRHGEGVLYDPQRRQWLLLPMEAHGTPELTPADEQLQRLWQEYFTTLGIAARKNEKLQRSKVPLKVRPWLVEFANQK